MYGKLKSKGHNDKEECSMNSTFPVSELLYFEIFKKQRKQYFMFSKLVSKKHITIAYQEQRSSLSNFQNEFFLVVVDFPEPDLKFQF